MTGAAPMRTDPPGHLPTAAPAPGIDPWPPPRRSFALPGMVLAMLGVAAASGAYMLWHAPFAPDLDGGPRCARAFDARLDAARGGSDAGLLALGEEALAAGCGRQAYDAAGLVGADAAARFCASEAARKAAPSDAALRRSCGPPPAPGHGSAP